MRIIIVMTYYDRQYQLDKTLYSIGQTKHKDFEVIIVDDCSPVPPKIGLSAFPIKVLKTKNKQWIDGSPAYNLGIYEALKRKADIIILQNAECYHVGDVLSYTENVTDKNYISFGCFSLSKQWTFRQHDLSWIIANSNRPAGDNENDAWFNHRNIRSMGYHWCSAITSDNMRKLNGFDERLSDGYWYEDDEFLARVRMLGLNVEVTDNPFVVHQWHERGYVPENKSRFIDINKNLFELIQQSGNPVAVHRFTKDFTDV
jgi:GT2 family glycosyltransferase